MYIIKSRREQKVMHHDKSTLCESRKLRKWLVDIQEAKEAKDRGTINLSKSSKNNRNGDIGVLEVKLN